MFDEIQEVPRALTSLKYFNENAPEHHILAAGSLVGVVLHPETSFPVGKVDFIDWTNFDHSLHQGTLNKNTLYQSTTTTTSTKKRRGQA
ncbi:MAG: AAA family ATPase [Alkaliphilus sp.]